MSARTAKSEKSIDPHCERCEQKINRVYPMTARKQRVATCQVCYRFTTVYDWSISVKIIGAESDAQSLDNLPTTKERDDNEQ
jgi:hypothetical protein